LPYIPSETLAKTKPSMLHLEIQYLTFDKSILIVSHFEKSQIPPLPYNSEPSYTSGK
jgi:hypothetical protein